MAKRRRRGKYKTRPVKPQPEAATTDDPSLQSQPVDDAAAAPVASVAPAPAPAPATGIPSTGMPIAAALGQQPPADNSEEQGYAGGGSVPLEVSGHRGPKEVSSSSSSDISEELQNLIAMGRGNLGSAGTGLSVKNSSSHGVQNWARGGSIPAPMPGYSDYASPRSDPVARRRYSIKHVGYAGGGEVDQNFADPMDYVPDKAQREREQPQQKFDDLNLIGRHEPLINPVLTDKTGYAKGGPIAAAQVPAYTDPVYPAPSAANADLYARMDAARQRVGAPAAARENSPFNQLFDKLAERKLTELGGGLGAGQGAPLNRFSASNSTALGNYAEGGEVDQQSSGPDVDGYVRGTNAMPPEQLDGVLQQIAQIDPKLDEDGTNLTAITEAARSGHMDIASSILAGFRKRFDSLNAHAQGAVAHGDLNVAAQLASKAHSQIPDGLKITYTPAQDSSVTATISPTGETFSMNAQQFHDYLVGPATSFDHILENGLVKNLTIASGGQRSGQQAQVANPAPTGYAQGGDVEKKGNPESEMREASQDDSWGRIKEQPFSLGRPGPGPTPLPPDNMRPRDTEPERRVFQPRGYQEGGEIEDDRVARATDEGAVARRAAEEAARVAVKDVLEHTRNQHGMGGGGLGRGAPTGEATPALRSESPFAAPISEAPAGSVPELGEGEKTVATPRATEPPRATAAVGEPLKLGPTEEQIRSADERLQAKRPPTITETEWQDYLAQQKGAGVETTGGGGKETGYYRPTEDPNDPWSRPAGVLAQAETAPVNRNITTSQLDGRGEERQVAHDQYGNPIIGVGRVFDQSSGSSKLVEGYMSPQSEERTGDRPYSTRDVPIPGTPAPYRPTSTQREYFTRGPNNEIRPTQAGIEAAQASGGRAPPGYPESRGAYPPELQPVSDQQARRVGWKDAREAAGAGAIRPGGQIEPTSQQVFKTGPDPTARSAAAPAAVNPAYSQEPFAGGVQETGQPVPTTSQRDQAAAQRAAQRVAVPDWAPKGSTVEQVQDGRAIARSSDGKIIAINGDRVVRDNAGKILNPSGGEPPRPQPQQQAQQAQQAQQPQVPRPPSSFYQPLGAEPGIPAPKYERTRTGQHLINGSEIQQAQHQWDAWNRESAAMRRMDAEWHTKQQQAIADMTPAQLIANHGHLLRTLPTLSEEDQRSARPIVDALREQMTRRGIAPPPQAAPAQPKSGGSMLNPANWFGGGGGGNAPAPRMGRLPDGTMVQID